MGSSLSLSGFRRPRPEPDDPSSSEEETVDTKRVKAAPYVLTVLQSSESVTKVLAYTGAGCVLTLETLSQTAHETIRGLNLEFEAPTTSDALRWGLILADRAELFALRRAGTLQKDRLAFSTTYCSEPVTGRSSDVENLREGVVRFASPRLPVAITTEDPLVDMAASEENLDAHARLHRGLLCQGVVRLDMTAQQGDLLGLRNQARYDGDSRSGGNWKSPLAGTVDDEVAAELMRAMAPMGIDTLPLCLREAATRDYSRLANQPMPDIDRLFDQVAGASAHLDAATLGRISTAFCWRFILAPPDLAASAPQGLNFYKSSYADEDAFLSVCQEAGVSSRVARSLWRDALRGSLLPFMPIYVKSGDLEDRPEYGLVRKCDTPLLEMHFYFRNRCCAHAVIERFGGDVEAIFGRENEEVLYRERFALLFGCGGAIALEILRRLKLHGAPGAFDAAVACLTSEERLPLLAEGDSVLVAPEWGDRSINVLPWEPARFLRMWRPVAGVAHVLVRNDQTGVESDIPLFALRRGYASDATPAAARVLVAAAAEGQNEILLRLLQAAPAFKEHAIGFTSTRFGDAESALDTSIAAGNVVGAALFMGTGSGGGTGGLVRTTSRAYRTDRAYLSPDRSPELRADMCAAIGMVANLNYDRRWRAPDIISVIERAAARGDDDAVRVEVMKATVALRLAGRLASVTPQRWRSMVDGARARFREELFLATQAAAWGGHASTVRKLLQVQDIGDDMAAEDSRTAALQYAVFQGHVECVEAVLDGWGEEGGARALRWALSRAAVCGHAHIIHHLRERGYSLYSPDDTDELTPLAYAARFGQPTAAAALCEDPDVARALQENREDNAILDACERHHSSVLRVLLETACQSSDYSWDKLEVCPLVAVTMRDDIASMEVFFDVGYPVDRGSHIKPLYVAATRGSRGMVELLLFHGASAIGQSPIDSALSACLATPLIDCPSERHGIAQRILQERPAEVSASLGMCLIHGVVRNCKLETLRMLLDEGAPVGAVFDESVLPATHGWTPLHYAVYFCVESHMKDADATYGGAKRSNADAVVRLLIERGAPLDTQSRDSHSLNSQRVVVGGSTPRDIAIACENGDVAVAVPAIIDHAVAKRDAARAAILA